MTGFLYGGNKIVGVAVVDLMTSETFEVKAKIVVNTSGPWVDTIRTLDFNRKIAPKMHPTKGVHLVVDAAKLPVPQPTYFDTGKNDGRMIFALPRENKTYFGTTDTDYSGDMTRPSVTQEDVDYLLDVINFRYPEAHLTINDIESSWAGLRPLIGDDSTDAPSSVSRGNSFEQEEDGLITLAGGKLTDYRMMAAGEMVLIHQLLENKYDLTFKKSIPNITKFQVVNLIQLKSRKQSLKI